MPGACEAGDPLTRGCAEHVVPRPVLRAGWILASAISEIARGLCAARYLTQTSRLNLAVTVTVATVIAILRRRVADLGAIFEVDLRGSGYSPSAVDGGM